ncbi:MAG: hypothetical protein A3C44_02520 [Gammaproteobacteria bacterium RIFCSPHIGHO2_02_FULL_39_13]|nr:MAG: hypothetical protein A3C44_02520 [Gammaproteobacteria bacterium RIFCSPHIGHO2_02_FULL_39_13]OGT50143.1 MAG: hypothetical protein A3E53_01825 [Gammaproteobacteria bacterium RIFCSPHIGHO2_12_FULL_39_24]
MKKIIILTLLSAIALGLGGCDDKRTLGAVGGAAVGGTVGGLAGGTTGAVIGGVAGAALGSALTKDKSDN